MLAQREREVALDREMVCKCGTVLSESELLEMFKAVQTSECNHVLNLMKEYFLDVAFAGPFEWISTFLLQFYANIGDGSNDAVRCRVSDVLRLIILGNPSLIDDFVHAEFDDVLMQLFPRANSIPLMTVLMEFDTELAEKFSCREMLSGLKDVLEGESEQTSDAIYMLGFWAPAAEDRSMFTEVVRSAARITLEAHDIDVTCDGLDAFGNLCHRDHTWITLLVGNPLFPSFLGKVITDEDTLCHFLAFITHSLSNPSSAPGMPPGSAIWLAIPDDLRLLVIQLVADVLSCETIKVISHSAQAIGRLAFSSYYVGILLSLNIHERLFHLLDKIDEFQCRVSLFGALCDLIAHSVSPQTEQILACGFMRAMNDLINGSWEAIPYKILNALQTLCHYAEMENPEFFGEIFGSPEVLAALEAMTAYPHTTEDDALNNNMPVSMVASGLYERRHNIPFD